MSIVLRKIEIDHINKDKIFDVIMKINKLVYYYAEKRKSKWVYETHLLIDIGSNPRCGIILSRISMEREFYHVRWDDTYYNSPFTKNKTLYEVINLFAHQYYPEYSTIETVIEKLLYRQPTVIMPSDFEILNELYKKLKDDGELPSAEEQIQEEDNGKYGTY